MTYVLGRHRVNPPRCSGVEVGIPELKFQIMKFPELLLLMLLPVTVTSQSMLSPCPSTGNKHNCFGTIVSASGVKHEGEFQNDKANGHGTRTYPNGSVFVGMFKDGGREGLGTFTTANGDKYVGEFRNDRFHGQGMNTFRSGASHVGNYEDGHRHGHGTYTFPDGKKKYIGEFVLDKFSGSGSMIYSDGSSYIGSFKDGKLDGFGTRTFFDGSKYVGELNGGRRNGLGVEYSAKGIILRSGRWESGRLIESFELDKSLFPFGG